jgi:hypothetical protein
VATLPQRGDENSAQYPRTPPRAQRPLSRIPRPCIAPPIRLDSAWRFNRRHRAPGCHEYWSTRIGRIPHRLLASTHALSCARAREPGLCRNARDRSISATVGSRITAVYVNTGQVLNRLIPPLESEHYSVTFACCGRSPRLTSSQLMLPGATPRTLRDILSPRHWQALCCNPIGPPRCWRCPLSTAPTGRSSRLVHRCPGGSNPQCWRSRRRRHVWRCCSTTARCSCSH